MLILFGGIVGLAVAAALVGLFVRWEREGKEQLAPLFLLGLLVVEGTIYANPNVIPRSIFHPGSGSTQLRLPEIYITLALIARLIVRGKPKTIGLPAGLWAAFAAWMLVGLIEGKLNHNPFSQDIYEAKDILYITGAYALAAGVPIRKYFERGDLFKLGTLCVVCASLLDLMAIAHFTVNTNLPGLPLQQFGVIGAETAALFLAVGTACFLTRMAMGPLALRHVLALIPLIVSVVLANQRAIIVNLGVVVLVVFLASIVGHWQGPLRRFQVGAGQVVLAVLAVVAVGLAVVVVPAAVDKKPAQIPLASTYQSLFHNQGKAESAQDRLNLAAEAEKLIPQHLIVGWGLGIEFPYYEAGSRTVVTIAYAHNLLLDLWLRLGIIGVVSFFLALVGSVAGGLRVWRRHRDPVTAALALAMVGVVLGLVATGFLEPLLDEYRFAVLFGVSLGILRACVTSMDLRSRALTWSAEAAGAGTPAGRTRWN